MDDKLEALFDKIVTEYTKDEWLEIINRIEKYIKFCEKDMKKFKKSLSQRGVSETFIQRECIWRSALNGFITEDDARKQMSECYNSFRK
jgi:hypothetical protein